VRPRRLEFGVELLVGRARDASVRQGIPLVRAFAELYEFTRVRVERRLRLTGACSLVVPTWDRFRTTAPRFLCDASLGGLARWLRASGYDAVTEALTQTQTQRRTRTQAGTEEQPLALTDRPKFLCERALATGQIVLTSDSRLLDRCARTSPGRAPTTPERASTEAGPSAAEGDLLVLWIPVSLTPGEQLRMTLRDLGLALREPRCMSCGGVLLPVAKDEVRARIPPRTALWRDDYTLCAGCDHLYWRGTHWERIARTLAASA